MKQDDEGPFRQTFSLDNSTGRFLKEEIDRLPLFDAARRFTCVFLSASRKDAVKLNHHLLPVGIRAYNAVDTGEAKVLLAITTAKILLIDLDRMFEPSLEILKKLDESYPNVPKVVLTSRDENSWSRSLSHFVFDVVPKPVHLGDLLGALECAHLLEQELNDPEGARARERRVLVAIRCASQPRTSKHLRPKIGRTIVSTPRSIWRSIRVCLSAMMDRVTHVWWKFDYHRTRKQHANA